MIAPHAQARGQGFLLSLAMLALAVRVALGIVHPDLGLSETALIGLTTVLLAAPAVYGGWFGTALLRREARVRYAAVTALACGLFLFYIVLA